MANTTQNRHASRAHEQMKEGVQTVAEGVQEVAGSVKRFASEGVDVIKGTASDYVDQGRERAREFSANVEKQVRDQPMKAILISAAAGFLLGLFMRR
jgi:ElaB/YqjD/DUF883 family membrane-anchored ribosome-binding protein